MILLAIVGFYLVGCVLAYGRFYGEFNERGYGFAMFSWIGFAVGCSFWERGPFLQFRDPKAREVKRIATIVRAKLDEPAYDFENNPPPAESWREEGYRSNRFARSIKAKMDADYATLNLSEIVPPQLIQTPNTMSKKDAEASLSPGGLVGIPTRQRWSRPNYPFNG